MSTEPHVLHPGDGDFVDLAGVGVGFLINPARSGGGFSCVEHPIAPRTLGSPIHTHSREDEYSFLLEGRIGVLLGDEVVEAGVGDPVFKPRDQPHAFWNASDEPARFLEIMSPAGFEQYFAEAAAMFPSTGELDMEPSRSCRRATDWRWTSNRCRGWSSSTGSRIRRTVSWPVAEFSAGESAA